MVVFGGLQNYFLSYLVFITHLCMANMPRPQLFPPFISRSRQPIAGDKAGGKFELS